MRFSSRNSRWAPYVPAAKRHANAAREAKALAKKGQVLRPIRIESRKIATSFWGISWCDNLEAYADWENRLPRGRTYARNGSIVDLQINPGCITAIVSGSRLYRLQVLIDKLPKKKWQAICKSCSTKIDSALDLLRGRLPTSVLEALSHPAAGLFPSPQEMKFECSCPDYAYMCKHVAAVLYGVGHLLDTEPELFFTLRGVDKADLVSQAISTQQMSDAIGLDVQSTLQGEDLGAIFGIDLASSNTLPSSPKPRKTTRKLGANSAQSAAIDRSAANEPERPTEARHSRLSLKNGGANIRAAGNNNGSKASTVAQSSSSKGTAKVRGQRGAKKVAAKSELARDKGAAKGKATPHATKVSAQAKKQTKSARSNENAKAPVKKRQTHKSTTASRKGTAQRKKTVKSGVAK